MNMREIKFRAWNDMIPAMLFFGLGENYIDVYDSLSDKFTVDITSKDVKVMQYTGLKDKNGVEIYEGDIIQSPNTTQWVVEWDNWNSCFQGISLSVIMHPIDHVNCQVIGNIYETPELLTK